MPVLSNYTLKISNNILIFYTQSKFYFQSRICIRICYIVGRTKQSKQRAQKSELHNQNYAHFFTLTNFSLVHV